MYFCYIDVSDLNLNFFLLEALILYTNLFCNLHVPNIFILNFKLKQTFVKEIKMSSSIKKKQVIGTLEVVK